MKPILPEIKMTTVAVATNLNDPILFEVQLPYYEVRMPYALNWIRQCVILPDGTHLGFGAWVNGKPVVLCNQDRGKTFKMMREYQKTGKAVWDTIPVEWLVISSLTTAWLNYHADHPNQYVVKLKGLPANMDIYVGTQNQHIADAWKGAYVQPYGKPLRDGKVCVKLMGNTAYSAVEPAELEEEIDWSKVPVRLH